MRLKKNKVLDIVVIGSGIAGLNFIEKYLEKKNRIDVITPFKEDVTKTKIANYLKILPSQMRKKFINVNKFYYANDINLKSNCKALGSLNFGGLSSYWGLQIDGYLNNDQKSLKKKNFEKLKNNFFDFIKTNKLIGSLNFQKKNYKNDYKIPKNLEELCKLEDKEFKCKKPILAFSTKKNFKGNLNNLNEIDQKFTADNFYKKIKKRDKIIFHNYYLKKIKKNKKLIEIICKNNNKEKKFLAKKIVLATGTIATTKILLDFLNISKEVKIKHHPRLLSVFFSKTKFNFDLNFTPSILQVISKSNRDYFSADIRPGNKLITESIIDAFPFMRPFKFFINFLKNRLIFSNILLDSSFSNLYLKKNNETFDLYSKNKRLKSTLKLKTRKVFKFLLKKKIILPFYKTFYPGDGADYHYFGSIPFSKKGKLAVNNYCELISAKNVYIVDGSVFNFKTNKYPLGIVAANARRVADHISK